MFTYIFYQEDDASVHFVSNVQVDIMYKWIKDQIWM